MYRARTTLFLGLNLAILLSLPLVNLSTRLLIGGQGLSTLRTTPVSDWWSRDELEGIWLYVLMQTFGMSTWPEKVVVGDDGFLFLGNRFNDVLDRTSGRYRPDGDAITAWAAQVDRFRTMVTSDGADFLFVLAPNKHSVYPEFLPPDHPPAPETVTDDVMALLGRLNIETLDLRDDLQALRERAVAYYRTDTHWTSAGAALAYERTIERLNAAFGTRLLPVDHALVPEKRPAGDLAAFLKIQTLMGPDAESGYALQLPQVETCLSASAMSAALTADCLPEPNRLVEVHDADIQVSRVSRARNPQVLLYLCDSFCGAASPLMNASFAEVHMIHWSKMERPEFPDYVAAMAPDIVVMQMVEREFLNPAIEMGR